MKRGCMRKSEDGHLNRVVHKRGQAEISLSRESQGTCAHVSHVCATGQVPDQTPGRF